MTDESPKGWTTPADHGNNAVWHSDRDCRCFPDETRARPLGTNEITSRNLSECDVCAGDERELKDNSGCERRCPYCNETVRLRDHLPCSGGQEAEA